MRPLLDCDAARKERKRGALQLETLGLLRGRRRWARRGGGWAIEQYLGADHPRLGFLRRRGPDRPAGARSASGINRTRDWLGLAGRSERVHVQGDDVDLRIVAGRAATGGLGGRGAQTFPSFRAVHEPRLARKNRGLDLLQTSRCTGTATSSRAFASSSRTGGAFSGAEAGGGERGRSLDRDGSRPRAPRPDRRVLADRPGASVREFTRFMGAHACTTRNIGGRYWQTRTSPLGALLTRTRTPEKPERGCRPTVGASSGFNDSTRAHTGLRRLHRADRVRDGDAAVGRGSGVDLPLRRSFPAAERFELRRLGEQGRREAV